MNAAELVQQCWMAGVTVVVQGDTVSLDGPLRAVTHFVPLLRPYKAEIMANASELTREFMEVDGLSFEEAEALALVSVPRLSADNWAIMLNELDSLIGRYCEAMSLPLEMNRRIHEARMRQSLASIPTVLRWFRDEIKSATDLAELDG